MGRGPAGLWEGLILFCQVTELLAGAERMAVYDTLINLPPNCRAVCRITRLHPAKPLKTLYHARNQ